MIEIFKSKKDHLLRFRFKANNNEKVLQSVAFPNDNVNSTIHVKNALDKMKNNGITIQKEKSENNEHYFKVSINDVGIVGWSETYKNKQGLNNGIRVTKEILNEFKIVDLT